MQKPTEKLPLLCSSYPLGTIVTSVCVAESQSCEFVMIYTNAFLAPPGHVTHAADELALIAAPAEMRAFLFSISYTLLGVSQIIAALFILSQNSPRTYWCFFCYSLPKTGLLTFVLTAASMLLLFPVYLGLSRVYRKLELSIIKPRNPIILPRRVFK